MLSVNLFAEFLDAVNNYMSETKLRNKKNGSEKHFTIGEYYHGFKQEEAKKSYKLFKSTVDKKSLKKTSSQDSLSRVKLPVYKMKLSTKPKTARTMSCTRQCLESSKKLLTSSEAS